MTSSAQTETLRTASPLTTMIPSVTFCSPAGSAGSDACRSEIERDSSAAEDRIFMGDQGNLTAA